MKRWTKLSWVLLLGTLACSPNLRIESMSDPATSVYAFRTYAWLDETDEDGNIPLYVSRATDQRIRQGIDGHMSRIGFQQVKNQPDLLIITTFNSKKRSGNSHRMTKMIPRPGGFFIGINSSTAKAPW